MLFRSAAGELVANHPALAAVRSFDPAVIADLAACEGTGIRDLAARCLTARRRDASEASVDLVLRWLGSLIVSPGDSETRRTQATAIARLLG